MAGGIYAAIVPCPRCSERADRIYEGLEDDHYRCSACGCEFGIDWASAGVPLKPCWPISELCSEPWFRTTALGTLHQGSLPLPRAIGSG